jgi:tRNA threonylcarbamoyladenosine biosynthesis protein TsaE
MKEIITRSPQETIRLGERIGRHLRGGEVISLVGNLGTGKTHLIKGIAGGVADCSEAVEGFVNSPTFVLVNEYLEGRLEIYHIDAYRLNSVTEFELLGFDDICHDNSVVLIEWADKVAKALQDVDTIQLELEHVSENERLVRFKKMPLYIRVQ